MNKTEEKKQFYREELLRFTNEPDYELLNVIVKSLGLSIFRADAELVSINDEKEVRTVKDKFLIKKLKLTNLTDDELTNAVNVVGDIVGRSNPKKYRAIFYYFLVKHFNMEYLFIEGREEPKKEVINAPIMNNDVEIKKIDELIYTLSKKKTKNLPNISICSVLVLNIIIIVILVYLLSQ